ncbi:hypothetical protein PUNSTDRAFT_133899 [Punctularia strigosozonata HHB-11173 SS5]|uniref:uncharacterized protein n=1 Tax=Punctularia strigosozonata (strain HHB-11173) TaxID=741275 RepID=UPI00044185F9|nr:uncharacterized protein PUNSTDRAFT_133899 [Punctularia strigosozonata HHB-11173 SS5]EIN08713.1 hypothetical protein PUNSTDRAFT_133899 [Punctularia strigosozonata HHB-11173 SS5]
MPSLPTSSLNTSSLLEPSSGPPPASLQKQLFAISITTIATAAIVCWDYLALLRAELRLYRNGGKALWMTPVTYAFVVLRYSVFVAMVPSVFFTSLQTRFCQLTVTLSELGLVLVVASSGVIFANRVVAIWGGSRGVTLLVGCLYVAMVVCWVVVGLQYHAVPGPPTPLFSNCILVDLVPWAPISYASSVVYDVVIFIMTLAKLKSPTLKDSAISRQIYRDSLLYMATTAAMNITVVSIQALPDSFELLKPTVVPFSTVITATMSQRVYLNLKQARKDQTSSIDPATFVLDHVRGRSTDYDCIISRCAAFATMIKMTKLRMIPTRNKCCTILRRSATM